MSKESPNVGNTNTKITFINPFFKFGDLLQGVSTDKLVFKLLRPQDLLFLEFRFLNFTFSGNKLTRDKNAERCLMMVTFPPQSIAEQCWDEGGKPQLPAKILMSRNSRLVFEVNRDLVLDVNDLLNWDGFDMAVNGRSVAAFDKSLKSIAVSEPQEWETSLEIPMRLYLSPTRSAAWNHKTKLNGTKGVAYKYDKNLYELWHTRMTKKNDNTIIENKGFGPGSSLPFEDDSYLPFEDRLLRILWGYTIHSDFNKVKKDKSENFLGNTSMNNWERHQLVHESSNFAIDDFIPQPVKANKLFLTALGAYLDSTFLVTTENLAKIPPNEKNGKFSLTLWRHIQTLAREHFVQVASIGYIMPFGHEAVLVKTTERKPDVNTQTATNFKRLIVIITQPVKEYSYYKDNKFMEFCFSKIEILNPISPLLSPEKESAEHFVIQDGNKDVQFQILATDLERNTANFAMPLIYVRNESIEDKIGVLKTGYNHTVDLKGQKVSLAPKAQKVSLAPTAPGVPEENTCDTVFAAYKTTFKVGEAPFEPQKFLPIVSKIDIREPSYKRLTGIDNLISVSLIDHKKFFDPKTNEEKINNGEVFAKINMPTKLSFALNSDKTGGFAMPDFKMTGLSRIAGAFGGNLEEFQKGNTTAVDYFTSLGPEADAGLFGVFKLSDILNFIPDDPAFPLTKIPKLITEDSGDKIITSYVLKPNMREYAFPDKNAPVKVVEFVPATVTPVEEITTGIFSIETTIVADKTGNFPPKFTTAARMEGFRIGIMKMKGMETSLISIGFRKLEFISSPGKSADINIEMANPALTFGGPLSFINAFQKLIPPAGFSDPPYLDVTTLGVKCGYTLALPSLQLGSFTLSNISLSADVNLPFTSAPMVLGFRFCEKQQPFTLTISCLGGGGYFGFEADLHGLKQLDAALEFGAAVALNLGVACGSVSVMAGIYFKIEFKDKSTCTQLTGYLRINGAMSILGLITASIELYMAFNYFPDNNKAIGEARISINVKVLFFSKSVEVHTSRTFSGSGEDPNFQMTYPPNLPKKSPVDPMDPLSDLWNQYCEAFAA